MPVVVALSMIVLVAWITANLASLAMIWLLVVSTVKILLPEPSWTARAVVEAMFIKRPPEAVKPERKAPVAFCRANRLDTWPVPSLLTRVGPNNVGLSEICWTNRLGWVEEAMTLVVVAKTMPAWAVEVLVSRVVVATTNLPDTRKLESIVEDP